MRPTSVGNEIETGAASQHAKGVQADSDPLLRELNALRRSEATLQAALRASEERLAAEFENTRLLQEISAQLVEQGNEEALCAKIVDAVAAIMRSDFATMQMLDLDRGAQGELHLLASRGLTPEGEKVWEWVGYETDSTCGQALRTGKRAIASDVETSDFLAGTGGMAALLDAGIHAAQSTPLYSRSGKLLGMISSHWRKPHTPAESDLRLLDILARQAADLIERIHTDEARREGERRLHEIVEAIPAAVYATDAEGRITFFNQAAATFAGRVPELGTDSWCVTWKLYNMDGTPMPHDQCPMAVALREKRPVLGCEAIAERPDGERRVFMPYPTPLFDAKGRLTGAVNMLVDITGRKHAEETIRESEERFRAIVETTPECVKVVAADGTLLMMNEAGLGMVGAVAAEDVAGRNVYDLIAPEDRETFRSLNERVCSGEKGSLEFDIVGLKGVRRRVETHAVPLHRPDGSVVHLGITRDVTDGQKAEETRLLLGAIVDSSDDAVISKNLNGIITSWNKSAERLFGYTEEEIIGQSVLMLIPEDRRDEEPRILSRLQRGERVDHFETVRRRKDGALLDISLTISPVRDPRGRIVGASKIARDVTERKRAEAELRRANQDLEQFAYSASHDLQEPLRTIKIYSELLSTHLSGALEGEAAQFLNFLQSGATRMEMLVRDLLAYTQVTQIEAPLEPFDTNEAFAEAVANLGGAITESGAAVTRGELPSVRVHKTHMRQLFQNLIGNAVKYRSEDRVPAIHVSAERLDGNWVFAVRDNGIGIQPEYKEQIFGLFSRLHHADRYDGTGIGLAICQRIVERCHGRIWVESEPGRGSEFRFTLPV
jgi:PAS domain S-box-containing protein